MFHRDNNGSYRLDAVVAVTPLQTYIHADPATGKAFQLAKPSRIVAMFHFAGKSIQSDTDYEEALTLFETAPTQLAAPPGGGS